MSTSSKSPSASVPVRKKSRFQKAPHAPKRFRPAFIFFSAEKHKEIRTQLGEKAMTERSANISKLVSEAWKNLAAEEKSKWEEMAHVDKTRYNLEKSRYKGPWRVQKERKTKDVNAPKRPMSAFLAFANSRRADLKRLLPYANNGELSRTLAGMWRKAPEDIRNGYIKEEHEKRARYLVTMAEWKKTNEDENPPEWGEPATEESHNTEWSNNTADEECPTTEEQLLLDTQAAARCLSQKAAAAAAKSCHDRDLDDDDDCKVRATTRCRPENENDLFRRKSLPVRASASSELPGSFPKSAPRKPQGAGTTASLESHGARLSPPYNHDDDDSFTPAGTATTLESHGAPSPPYSHDDVCFTPAFDMGHPYPFMLDRYHHLTSSPAMTPWPKSWPPGRPLPDRFVRRSMSNPVRLLSASSNLAYNLSAPCVIPNPLSFPDAFSLTPSLCHVMLPTVAIPAAASAMGQAGHVTLNDLHRSGLTMAATPTEAYQHFERLATARATAAAFVDQRLDIERSRNVLLLQNERNARCMESLQGRLPFAFHIVDGAANRIPGLDFPA